MRTVLLAAVGLALWPRGQGEVPTAAPPEAPRFQADAGVESLAPLARPPVASALPAEAAPVASDREVLAAALREEMVPLTSSVVVEAIERDRDSAVVARSASDDITWDRLERVTQYWDGGVDISTRKWSEVIRVEEGLERGGFRGQVLVSPSEALPGTKQILDFLYGYDTSRQEVIVSWSPFKSEPPAVPREPVDPLPAK